MAHTNDSPTSGIKPGDVLVGKYRIEKVLGAGGMGVVVAAHHLQLDERVAIKLLLPEVLDVPEAVARFAREARAAVKIKSEHVARVIDVGNAEGGAPYMVMEYLEGVDLSGWLKEKGRLPAQQAVEFLLQACEAIAEAHSIGIVHRDLKPANLFLTLRPDGSHSVKVLDFGISKVTSSQSGDSGLGMTRTAAMMGTPYYMSPEQLRSARDVDARTDIWALGAILYELVAGNMAFDGETLPDLCIKIMNHPTPLIRSACPEVPLALERVICKCLEKEPAQRYSNIAQFAVALGPFGPSRARLSVERIQGVIYGKGLAARGSVLSPSTNGFEPAAQTGVAWGQTAGARPNRGKWIAVAALGVVTALGLALAWSLRAHFVTSRETPATSIAQQAATGPLPSAAVVQATDPRPPAASTPAVVNGASTTAALALTPDAGALLATPTVAVPRSGKAIAEGTNKRASARPTASTNEPATKPPAAASKSDNSPKSNCDPPYTLDDQGRKHFKAECF